MEYYSSYITKLVEQLGSLPGIGRKTAQRLAFHIMNMPKERAEALANSITEAREHIRYCSHRFAYRNAGIVVFSHYIRFLRRCQCSFFLPSLFRSFSEAPPRKPSVSHAPYAPP